MFIMFCLVVSSIAVLPNNRQFVFDDLIADGEYCFYADVDEQSIPNARIVQNGISAMVFCDIKDAEQTKKHLKRK